MTTVAVAVHSDIVRCKNGHALGILTPHYFRMRKRGWEWKAYPGSVISIICGDCGDEREVRIVDG